MGLKLKKIMATYLCITSIFVSCGLGIAAASDTIPSQQTAVASEENIKFLKVSTIPKGEAYIPKDTKIEVELTSEISSKTSHKGDIVPLRTSSNLVINDVVVIPAGTRVNGVITTARKNGMFGRSGKLEFSITDVKTRNNIRVPLQYAGQKKAGDDGGAVAVAATVTLVGGFFMKGKNVSIPAGTQFEAAVASDTDLQATLADLKDIMDEAQPNSVVITLK